MSNIWFTSDNHFGHKNIMNFCPRTRKANSINHMNQLMVQKWQEQVQPEDHVYLLGDVFFCRADEAIVIMDQLPGQKHLIYGNHDKVIKSNGTLRNKFVSVADYHEMKIDGIQLILFHFPIHEWHKCHCGAYQLFGHVHGNKDNDPFTCKYRTMDVGIDSRPYDANQDKPLYELWSWREVHSILKDREILGHH